jgi:hypothetical protein
MFTYRSMFFASIGVLIFFAGTLIGRAQQPRRPDFEITVSAPAATITVACVHGCQLQRSEPIDNELRRSITLTDSITSTCPGTGCKWSFSGIVVGLQKGTH